MAYEDFPQTVKDVLPKSTFEEICALPHVRYVWTWHEGLSVKEILKQLDLIAVGLGLVLRPLLRPGDPIDNPPFNSVGKVELIYEYLLDGIPLREVACEVMCGDTIVVYGKSESGSEASGSGSGEGLDVWYQGNYCGGWRRGIGRC